MGTMSGCISHSSFEANDMKSLSVSMPVSLSLTLIPWTVLHCVQTWACLVRIEAAVRHFLSWSIVEDGSYETVCYGLGYVFRTRHDSVTIHPRFNGSVRHALVEFGSPRLAGLESPPRARSRFCSIGPCEFDPRSRTNRLSATCRPAYFVRLTPWRRAL